MKLVAGAAVVMIAGTLALGLGERAPAATETVTISFQRYFDQSCGCWKMRFFGKISSTAPNEYVGLLQQSCGAKYPTAVAGTQSLPGGEWETDTYFGGSSAAYRASWNGELSKPVAYRPPLAPQVKRLAAGKYRVSVLSWALEGKPQNMQGDAIHLQRLTAGQWKAFRVAELTPRPGPSAPKTYAATFTVPRGLELRAFLPAKSAKPCFAAGSSAPFHS